MALNMMLNWSSDSIYMCHPGNSGNAFNILLLSMSWDIFFISFTFCPSFIWLLSVLITMNARNFVKCLIYLSRWNYPLFVNVKFDRFIGIWSLLHSWSLASLSLTYWTTYWYIFDSHLVRTVSSVLMGHCFQFGYITQLVKCFLHNNETLSLVPRTKVEIHMWCLQLWPQ